MNNVSSDRQSTLDCWSLVEKLNTSTKFEVWMSCHSKVIAHLLYDHCDAVTCDLNTDMTIFILISDSQEHLFSS